MRRTYYKTCDKCGANLDPGERCDCAKDKIVVVTARDWITNKRKRPVKAV